MQMAYKLLEFISEFNVNYTSLNILKIIIKSEFTNIAKYKFSIEKSLHINNKIEKRV